MPICLSDRQSLTVTNAAAARDQFYQAVAHQLAGHEIADGSVLSVLASPAYVSYAWDNVRAGCVTGGRDPDKHRMVVYVIFSMDDDSAKAREFYQRVFGLTPKKMEGGGMEYWTLHNGDEKPPEPPKPAAWRLI